MLTKTQEYLKQNEAALTHLALHGSAPASTLNAGTPGLLYHHALQWAVQFR